MQAVKQWFKTNWQFAAMIATVVLAAVGVRFTIQPGPADSPPEVIIIVPTEEAAPTVIRDDAVGPVEWSVLAKVALRAAVAILERRAPLTPSDRDDRLLAFLKLIAADPPKFEAAAAAAGR